jgi:hypothetical protein
MLKYTNKVRSMDHESESDSNIHASVAFYDANGTQICNTHITRDPKKQEV